MWFKGWASEAYRHTLQETDIEAELVPFHGCALDLNKREADLGVPLLRRAEDQVVERLADLAANGRGRVLGELHKRISWSCTGGISKWVVCISEWLRLVLVQGCRPARVAMLTCSGRSTRRGSGLCGERSRMSDEW